jgi:hypothetical protein
LLQIHPVVDSLDGFGERLHFAATQRVHLARQFRWRMREGKIGEWVTAEALRDVYGAMETT